jgi:malate synthase
VKGIFDAHMPAPNQIDRKLDDVNITANDLLAPVHGNITETGLRQNVVVALGYLESWLRGIGCVPLFNLMEDAATAEISRAQLWQWVHHKAHLADGRLVNLELCLHLLQEEMSRQRQLLGVERFQDTKYLEAAQLLQDLIASASFVEFLTQPAYQQLLVVEDMRVAEP